MTTITPEQLDELERKAKAATPGEWAIDPMSDTTIAIHRAVDDHHIATLEPRDDGVHAPETAEQSRHREADAEYIAAAHPATTLALIARIRELEGAVAAERERCAKIVEEPWEANSWVESDSEYLARRIRAG